MIEKAMTFLDFDSFDSHPDEICDNEGSLGSGHSLARVALTTRRLPGDETWLVWDILKGLNVRDRYDGSCFYDDKGSDIHHRTIVFVFDKKHTLSFLSDLRTRIADLTSGTNLLAHYNQIMDPDYQPRHFLLASVDVNKYSSISFMITDSFTEEETQYLAQMRDKKKASLEDAIKCFSIINENSRYPVIGKHPTRLDFPFKEILRSPSHVMRPILDYMFTTKDKNIHRQFIDRGLEKLGKYVVRWNILFEDVGSMEISLYDFSDNIHVGIRAFTPQKEYRNKS